jgi:hypothetical protein
MDERRLRYPAGSNGDGTTHRVGLTRHCLASGAVQLPFALRDSLPEGDLQAYDVVRDETVVLTSEPPRRLAGLARFFSAHELQVNDQLELRLHGGRVGLAPRPRLPAHDAAGEARAVRAPSRWSSRIDPTPPSARPSGEDRPDVVERIGSVTVRRLGAEDLDANAASRLASPEDVAEGPATRGADLAGPSDEDLDALLVTGPAEEVAPEQVPRPATRGEPATAAPGAAEASFVSGVAETTLVPDALEATTVPPAADAPRGTPRSGAVQQGVLFGPPASEPPRRARRGRTPRRALRGASAASATRPDVPRVREEDLADPAVGASVGPVRRSAAPVGPAPAPAPEASAGRAGATARHELRRRVVRWLLQPDTPVVVPYERVQDEFDLSGDATRDVLGAILETPPPTLRLTLLREGMLRVARVTVEQEA